MPPLNGQTGQPRRAHDHEEHDVYQSNVVIIVALVIVVIQPWAVAGEGEGQKRVPEQTLRHP